MRDLVIKQMKYLIHFRLHPPSLIVNIQNLNNTKNIGRLRRPAEARRRDIEISWQSGPVRRELGCIVILP